MGGILGGLMGGGGGGGGGEMTSQIFDAALSAYFQSNEAKKGRNFAEAVGKNKIRWAVNDMKRAGINPLTMFMGGGSVTGGAPGTGGNASISRGSPGAIRAGAEADRAAAETKKAGAETSVKEKQLDLLDQQIFATQSAAHRDIDQGGLFSQQKNESAQRTKLLQNQTATEQSNAGIRGQELIGAINRGNVNATTYGKSLEYIKALKGAINPLEPRSKAR